MSTNIHELAALQELFEELKQAKRELKDNYRQDLADIERRQFEILDRLRYVDERADQGPEQAATRATLDMLENMELPQHFGPTKAPAPLHKTVTMKEAADNLAAIKTAAEAAAQAADKESNAAENLSEPLLPPAEPINKLAEALAPDLPVQDPTKNLFTGIKEGFDKVKRYQCFYHCDNKRCRHKGKHFIEPSTTRVYCHECGRSLQARPATSKGWPHSDTFNNFFIAGARKTEEELEAERSTPIESVDNALKAYEKERAEKSPAPSSSSRVGPVRLAAPKAEPQAAEPAK